MKTKLLILSLFLSLNLQAQKLPINNLCLSDVLAYFNCPYCTFISCLDEAFARANPAYFDPTYAIAGSDCLSEFRNYGPSSIIFSISEVFNIDTTSGTVTLISTEYAAGHGVIWGSSADVVWDTKIGATNLGQGNTDTNGTNCNITGLTSGVTYYVRGYKTVNNIVYYTAAKSFMTAA